MYILTRWGIPTFTYDMTALPPPRKNKQKHYINLSFGIFSNENELLLIFQLHSWEKKPNLFNRLFKRKTKLGLSSFHGLCVKDNLPDKTYRILKQNFETYMDLFWKRYQCRGLDVSLPPFCDLLRPENVSLINPLIYWNFRPFLGYTYIIDLKQPMEQILANYTQTTRNLLNRIIRENRTDIFETNGSMEDYEILKHLNDLCYSHQATEKKLTDDYLSSLWAIIEKKELCRCFFCKENTEILCYVILLYHKDCAYYFWGGGAHQSQNIQRYLLHSVISLCKEEGYKWFEVGAANIWLRNGKDKSISDYKKSFSHALHPIYKGSYIPA